MEDSIGLNEKRNDTEKKYQKHCDFLSERPEILESQEVSASDLLARVPR